MPVGGSPQAEGKSRRFTAPPSVLDASVALANSALQQQRSPSRYVVMVKAENIEVVRRAFPLPRVLRRPARVGSNRIASPHQVCSPVDNAEAAGLHSPLVEKRRQMHLLPLLKPAVPATICGRIHKMAGSRPFSVWSVDCCFMTDSAQERESAS